MPNTQLCANGREAATTEHDLTCRRPWRARAKLRLRHESLGGSLVLRIFTLGPPLSCCERKCYAIAGKDPDIPRNDTYFEVLTTEQGTGGIICLVRTPSPAGFAGPGPGHTNAIAQIQLAFLKQRLPTDRPSLPSPARKEGRAGGGRTI